MYLDSRLYFYSRKIKGDDLRSLEMFNASSGFSSLKTDRWMIFDAQPTAQKSLRVSSIIQRIYFCYARLKLYSHSRFRERIAAV